MKKGQRPLVGFEKDRKGGGGKVRNLVRPCPSISFREGSDDVRPRGGSVKKGY